MSSQLKGISLKDNFKEVNVFCRVGFWFGIVSILLFEIGVIPLFGLIISIIGLVKFDKEKQRRLWMGVVGLILNLLYLVANAYLNGNID